MDNNRQNPQNNDNQPKMPRFNMNWLYIIVAVVLAILLFSGGGDSIARSAGGSQEANYSDFKAYVNKGYAQRVVVNKSENTLRMYVKPKFIRNIFNMTAQQVGSNPYLTVQFGLTNWRNFLIQPSSNTSSPALVTTMPRVPTSGHYC